MLQVTGGLTQQKPGSQCFSADLGRSGVSSKDSLQFRVFSAVPNWFSPVGIHSHISWICTALTSTSVGSALVLSAEALTSCPYEVPTHEM